MTQWPFASSAAHSGIEASVFRAQSTTLGLYSIRCFGAGAFPDPMADGSQIKGWDQEVFCTQCLAQEMQLKTTLYLSYFCSLLIRRC